MDLTALLARTAGKRRLAPPALAALLALAFAAPAMAQEAPPADEGVDVPAEPVEEAPVDEGPVSEEPVEDPDVATGDPGVTEEQGGAGQPDKSGAERGDRERGGGFTPAQTDPYGDPEPPGDGGETPTPTDTGGTATPTTSTGTTTPTAPTDTSTSTAAPTDTSTGTTATPTTTTTAGGLPVTGLAVGPIALTGGALLLLGLLGLRRTRMTRARFSAG